MHPSGKLNPFILSIDEYRDILENTSGIIVYSTPAREIKFISPSCNTITGYTEKEIMKNPLIWVDPDDMETIRDTIEYVYDQAQSGKNLEYRALKKDGSFWYASTSWQPVIKDNQVTGFVFTTHDITWKKINESIIKSSKDRLSSVFESTLDRITVWDRDYNIIYANEAELMFYGRQRNELVGHKVQELFEEYHANFFELKNKVELVFETGTPQKIEVPCLRKDQYIIYEVLISPIVSGSGEIQTAVIVYRDITERKKQQTQLQLLNDKLAISNSELEQFAYIASHDLQEPLRAISGFIQLLKKRYGEKLDESANHFIDRSIAAAERMKGLIQDVLSFSRVTTKSSPFEIIDMNKVVKTAIQNLELTILEKNANIDVKKLPSVEVDESQMIQLFQNLISNGIKFSRKNNCEISIFSEYDNENNEYIFSVQDNGIGIEKQYIDKIFLIFERLHTTQEYEGSGIGLAICKRILERHNGKIWVNSEYGKGSVFSFSIPDNRRNNYES